MNTLRRIYMTMVSAQTQFFEKIASKLSQDAVASSHHSEWPASLMESHIRLADRQLSSIHSLTSQMVNRINDLHKLRLNLVKLSDPLKRIFNLSSDYSGLAGAVLMLAPSPLLKGLGMLFSMVSLGIGVAESWRSRDIEYQLDQRMAEYGDWFNSAQVSSNDFFSANLLAPTDDSDFQSSVGPAGDLVVSDLPRAVVDYANAHLYLNPQADHVQGLLPQVFPNGVPSDPAAIINAVHAFMMQSTRYVSDGDHDVWSDVNDVAVSLEGDCEDLINLEHSLLLAAFEASGQPYPTPVNHAAYVMQDGQRVGHVFMTIEVNGETMVLDPSLETGMVPYSEYQQTHGVECVFTYTADQTHVIDPSALGIQTSTGISGVLDGFLSNLVDDDGLTSFFDGFVMSPGATDEDMIREMNSRMIDSVMDAIKGSGGLLGDIADVVLNDVLQLDDIMKSFLPGGG